jgi:hypothetical protein
MDFELENISNYSDTSDLMYILSAALSVDVASLSLVRYYKVGGKYLNEWYDQFNILAVLVDVLIIFIGFLIARYLYSSYLIDRFEWAPVYFMILLVGVQVLHDMIFYFGIIKNVPQGNNEMIDLFKKYAEELGGIIYGGNAMIMIATAILAMAYKAIPFSAFVCVSSLFVYAMPYILYTRNPFVVEEKTKEKEKEKEKPAFDKIDAYNRLLNN